MYCIHMHVIYMHVPIGNTFSLSKTTHFNGLCRYLYKVLQVVRYSLSLELFKLGLAQEIGLLHELGHSIRRFWAKLSGQQRAGGDEMQPVGVEV